MNLPTVATSPDGAVLRIEPIERLTMVPVHPMVGTRVPRLASRHPY